MCFLKTFPNKIFMLKIKLPNYPDMLLLGINPKDSIASYKNACSSVFTVVLLIRARKWNHLINGK